jgi:WD40 repeat protein
MYKVDLISDLDPSSDQIPQFNPRLMTTAHAGEIRAVLFPEGCPELIITAGRDIRIWNVKIRAELLRIEVKGVEGGCHCIDLSADGTLILSGWADGKIRAFLPESGKLAFCVDEAHREECTAVKFYSGLTLGGAESFRFISGGADHNVRVWEARTDYGSADIWTKMVYSMKEHKKMVYSIAVSLDNETCVSASTDGSCITWLLQGPTAGKRLNAVFANTEFMAVKFYPDDSQYLTTGTDRKVCYWDVAPDDTTGNGPIRDVQASDEGIVGGPLRALDISGTGAYFASGGDDKLVKLWRYDEGELEAVGVGHSKSVKALKIAPGDKSMVSVGEEGAIMIWTL